jgi:hypothetical protein
LEEKVTPSEIDVGREMSPESRRIYEETVGGAISVSEGEDDDGIPIKNEIKQEELSHYSKKVDPKKRIYDPRLSTT